MLEIINFLADTTQSGAGDALNLSTLKCSSLGPVLSVLKLIIRIIQIGVPFALVIWGSLDFFKALIAGDEKEMKMKRKPFISRLVAAIIILVLPWLVELITGQIAGKGNADNIWKCYHNATPGINFGGIVTDDNNEFQIDD